jgi:hypothetical protein
MQSVPREGQADQDILAQVPVIWVVLGWFEEVLFPA